MTSVAAIVIGIPFFTIFNQPTQLVSHSYGTIVGAEFYPAGKWDAQMPPKLRLMTDSGRELLLNQAIPYKLANGERVAVKIWKRRLFGYKTTYEKVALSASE